MYPYMNTMYPFMNLIEQNIFVASPMLRKSKIILGLLDIVKKGSVDGF